jgi:cytochrome c peroxidase
MSAHLNRTRMKFSVLFVLVFAMALPLAAHIVPPEEFHPVAESYRRMTFLLNLNPIPWEAVHDDAHQLQHGLVEFSTEAAESYEVAVDALVAPFTDAGEEAPSSSEHKAAARKLFELSTGVVSEIIARNLRGAQEALGDSEACYVQFEAARQVWAAFDHEVKAADKQAFRELGIGWLTAAGAIGSKGTLGVGAVPPDADAFGESTEIIVAYVVGNFQTDFRAPESGRLAPIPYASDTVNLTAHIPLKLPPGSNINKQLPRPRQILNMAERGVDESDTPLIALGDMVFDSSFIFGEPARSMGISCNTCHNKGVTNPGFTVAGLSSRSGGMDVSNNFFAPHANNGHFDPLDIPDLRGIRFTAPYGRNGRFSSLREFSRNVIVHEFNGPEPDPVIMDAMIAYMNEFDFLPNDAMEANGTLRADQSEAAKRGEVIFNRPFDQMQGMSCASCHIPSNNFVDGKRHDIGSVHGATAYSRDGALDTPTLLSAKYTPPYFHDGSVATLHDVNVWFNEQYRLGLSEDALGDLTAYVEAISSGIDAREDTMYTLESEMEEFKFFLSSYEYLKLIDRPEVMNVLFETVTFEIGAHKWDVQDPGALPILNQLAALMGEALSENKAGNRAGVDTVVGKYRKLYNENVEILK